MGYELKVKNDKGEVLNLSTSPKYAVYKVTGLQPPAVAINSSSNATTDGSTVNSVRVGTRNIVVYLTLEGDVESSRIELYKYFPLKKRITLYFKNGSRDVCIEGYVEIIECDPFTKKQIAQVSILCPQPYFKAVDDLISYFSEITPLLEFPFSLTAEGAEFSSINSNIRKSIINTGDVESGLIIDLTAVGEVVNPAIYDTFKRTFIKLRFTMQSGDRIVINTNTGAKAITLYRGGTSFNIMGYMTPDSTWLTLGAGDNVFTYGADDNSSVNLQLTFTASVLYGGV